MFKKVSLAVAGLGLATSVAVAVLLALPESLSQLKLYYLKYLIMEYLINKLSGPCNCRGRALGTMSR
ncbi:MAG TPA: hypothetical protein EYP82_04145 [Hydrogenothermaceae bacterium]|nr:hypothetical protein [Hydrogenothermaceae bacterium]